MSTETACKDEIIRHIEKAQRKGCVEGILFNPCIATDTNETLVKLITVPSTHISVSGSGVRWKMYGHAGSSEKARK